MSKYTTEIRFICETMAGLSESVGVESVDEIIDKAMPHIFNFNYPIFDENYRKVLQHKILLKYYTREIAFETVGLWKLKLNAKLNEIMPYYNKLYESELIQFNPMKDHELTRTHNVQNNGSKTDNGSSSSNTDSYSTNSANDDVTNTTKFNELNKTTSNASETNKGSQMTNVEEKIDNSVIKTSENTTANKDLYSETPQGSVSNLETSKYLTNARLTEDKNNARTEDINKGDNRNVTDTRTDNVVDSDSLVTNDRNNDGLETSKRISHGNNNSNSSSNGSTNNNSITNSTEDYLENVSGKIGSATYSEMLLKYRDTFLNIDSLIIEQLWDLFYTLW